MQAGLEDLVHAAVLQSRPDAAGLALRRPLPPVIAGDAVECHVGGVAAGTWRLDGPRLVVDAFGPIPGEGLQDEAQDVARFLGRELAVSVAGSSGSG